MDRQTARRSHKLSFILSRETKLASKRSNPFWTKVVSRAPALRALSMCGASGEPEQMGTNIGLKVTADLW
jgi:hypothetical protein